MLSVTIVVLALVGAVSASVCGTETTRCDLANACATCLPNPSLCVESAPDASGIITLTTRVNQNFGAAITGLPWSYPAGVRIVVDNNAGVTFGSASSNTIRLCIPSGRTISTTAFITANGGVVSMAGNVELVTSSVVPNNALTFLNANTASSNWLGLFASIKSVEATVAGTTPNPCFTTVASASYNTATVTATFTQTNSGAAGCVPVVGGLSGGAIAGIVIGSLVGAAALVVLAIFLIKKFDFDSKRQLFSRTKIHAAESSVPM